MKHILGVTSFGIEVQRDSVVKYRKYDRRIFYRKPRNARIYAIQMLDIGMIRRTF